MSGHCRPLPPTSGSFFVAEVPVQQKKSPLPLAVGIPHLPFHTLYKYMWVSAHTKGISLYKAEHHHHPHTLIPDSTYMLNAHTNTYIHILMIEDRIALCWAIGFPSCWQARAHSLLASKLGHLTGWIGGGVMKCVSGDREGEEYCTGRDRLKQNWLISSSRR